MCVSFLIHTDSEPALCATRATFVRIRDYPLLQLTRLLNRCGIGDRYAQQSESENTEWIYELR